MRGINSQQLTVLTAVVTLSAASATSFAALSGDVNADHVVNFSDMLMVVGQFNEDCPASSVPCPTDIDQDGRTGFNDLVAVLSNWGASEPADQASSDNTEAQTQEENLVGPAPVLMDGVYYDMYAHSDTRADLGWDLDQGAQTRSWNAENGVAVLPFSYGGMDYNSDNQVTAQDLVNFQAWLEETIPADYDGPVVLDMEGQWWQDMYHATQVEMDEIIEIYIQGLEFAETVRPNAKFGYWGLPKKSMTHPNYQYGNVDRLLKRSGAIFPETYDNNPGVDNSTMVQNHIATCIEIVEGQVPVYAQLFPRFRDEELGGWRHFHENEEVLNDQAQPALDARWTDDDGNTHRVAGIALWDAYVLVQNFHPNWDELSDGEISNLWNEVDEIHLGLFQDLAEMVAEEAGEGEGHEAEAVAEVGDSAPESEAQAAGGNGVQAAAGRATTKAASSRTKVAISVRK